MYKKAFISLFLIFVLSAGSVFAQGFISFIVSPAQNALDVSKGTNISVIFDQDMNASTINDSTFVIHSLQTGLQTGTYDYNNGTHTVTFDPDKDFAVGEVVSVILTTGIENATGDTLISPYEWSFTIEVDGGSGEFATRVGYAAGDGPHSVFSSDLDSDGDMDLAVANCGSDNVSVLLNNGDGTFASKVDYAAGDSAYSVFSSDLDSDGDMDLAVANRGSDNVSVLLNNGNGTFASKVDYAADIEPVSVFSSDLDGDGNMDLAVANYYPNSISVLFNNGDGTFAETVFYLVGSDPYSIFSSDLDSDGDMDLAVANCYSTYVSILMNNGDGTFALRLIDLGEYLPNLVFSSNLDGDGDMDLTVLDYSSIFVLMNNGDGTFVKKQDEDLGSNLRSVFSSDLDGDGDMDITVALVPFGFADIVFVFFNDGEGNLIFTKRPYYTGDDPGSIFSSDLDGDGDMDLAVTNCYSDSISVLLNNDFSAIPIPALPKVYSMSVKPITTGNKLEVRYALPVRSCVKFSLYDIRGARVKKITEDKPAGYHSAEIDMKGRPKGVYFLKIEANGFTKISKAVLM